MEKEHQSLLVVGGLSCKLNNDNHFSALRAALGYEPWLAKAVASFDWKRMMAGGGKGGDKMARTNCRRLFVKEVSGGDEATLCDLGFLEVRGRRAARAGGASITDPRGARAGVRGARLHRPLAHRAHSGAPDQAGRPDVHHNEQLAAGAPPVPPPLRAPLTPLRSRTTSPSTDCTT